MNGNNQLEPPCADQYVRTHVFAGTYSPADDKLRLYPCLNGMLNGQALERLAKFEFKHGPGQEAHFFAFWIPLGEDLLFELCGDIEDETKTPAERTRENAARASAHKRNHDEPQARADSGCDQDGPRKAAGRWGIASYWEECARAAIDRGEHLNDPEERYRLIQELKAKLHRSQHLHLHAGTMLEMWKHKGLTLKLVEKLVPIEPEVSPEEWNALWAGTLVLEDLIRKAVERNEQLCIDFDRIIDHVRMRTLYEMALLEAAVRAQPLRG